jgi:hypothetical protein
MSDDRQNVTNEIRLGKAVVEVHCVHQPAIGHPSPASLAFTVRMHHATGSHSFIVAGDQIIWVGENEPDNVQVRLKMELAAFRAVNMRRDHEVVKERAMMAQTGGVH